MKLLGYLHQHVYQHVAYKVLFNLLSGNWPVEKEGNVIVNLMNLQSMTSWEDLEKFVEGCVWIPSEDLIPQINEQKKRFKESMDQAVQEANVARSLLEKSEDEKRDALEKESPR